LKITFWHVGFTENYAAVHLRGTLMIILCLAITT